ncbi:MAG: hypothetical protein QM770_05330 [Tepidisphaeraceae bacterium]
MSTEATEKFAGVSCVWVSDEPLPRAWREKVARGDFAAAQALFANTSHPLEAEAADLIHRLRWEWSLGRAELAERLRTVIADASDTDIDRWTKSGALQSLNVDGQLRYFRREPRHLLLHDDEAKRRRTVPDTVVSSQRMVPHLEELVRLSETSTSPEIKPVRTLVTYVLVVKGDRPGAKRGSTVRCWLPFPQVYRQQRDVRLIDSFPKTERVAPRSSAQAHGLSRAESA